MGVAPGRCPIIGFVSVYAATLSFGSTARHALGRSIRIPRFQSVAMRRRPELNGGHRCALQSSVSKVQIPSQAVRDGIV
jgi:hypothetical protein